MAHTVTRNEDGSIKVVWDNGRKTIRTANFSKDTVVQNREDKPLVSSLTDAEIFEYAQFSVKAIRRIKKLMRRQSIV